MERLITHQRLHLLRTRERAVKECQYKMPSSLQPLKLNKLLTEVIPQPREEHNGLTKLRRIIKRQPLHHICSMEAFSRTDKDLVDMEEEFLSLNQEPWPLLLEACRAKKQARKSSFKRRWPLKQSIRDEAAKLLEAELQATVIQSNEVWCYRILNYKQIIIIITTN